MANPSPQTAPLLVTGGAGFIGSCFVRRAVSSGMPVVNLDALTYAGTLTRLPGLDSNPLHRFIHADIRDRIRLSEIVSSVQPAAIIHFAAESHVDRSITDPSIFIETNVLGTGNILAATLEFWEKMDRQRQERFRFLHISTDEVFGTLGKTGAFTETSPYNPRSPYAASKASADHLVRAFHLTHGLPILIANCSNNYGPWQFPEKLIGLMVVRALTGQDLPVYGDGSNVRDWIHVEDSCSAFEAILNRGLPGESYCIGGDNEWSNLDTVRALCGILDECSPSADGHPYAGRIAMVTDRPGHDFRYATNTTKARQALGWAGSRDFMTGLASTVAWFNANRQWWQPLLSQVYGGQRLGLRQEETQ